MPRPARRLLAPDHNNRASWYTRGEVAKLIGLTLQGVRYLHETGVFHAWKDAHGEWRLDPAEVDRYLKARADRLLKRKGERARAAGEIAAAAFAMFDQGRTRREVVTTLKLEPEQAQRLWEQWQPETFEEAQRLQQAAAAKRAGREEQRTRKERFGRLRELLEPTTTTSTSTSTKATGGRP